MDLDRPLADLVLLAYQAAGDPELWPRVMDTLSEQFGGPGGGAAVIEAHDRRTGACAIVTGSDIISPECLKRYVDYYAAFCPRVAAGRRLPPETIHHDDLIGDESALDRSEYYTDFLAPQGYRYFVGGNIVHDPLQQVILSIQRPPAAGRVDAHIIEDFSHIRPHIGSAFVLSQALESYKAQSSVLEEITEHLQRGVVLVNVSGEVVFMNQAAEDMIGKHAGLWFRERHLSAADPQFAVALDDLLAHAIELISGSANGNNRTLRLADSGGIDLLLRAVPLPRSPFRVRLAEPAVAALLIEALPPRTDLVPARLRTLFGLTRTEAELAAAFAAGASLEELSERRRVSIATIRTHFVHIRDKMGARNLAELMRLILSAAAPEVL